MRRARSAAAGLRAIACAALACAASAAEPPPKPRLTVLATGGTIAGESRSETDASYRAGALAVDVLLDAVPRIRDLAVVRGEQVAAIGSQDMSDEIWLRLAARTGELLASDDVDGVVITHGTDTLEETAYFLHLAVRTDKPIVMTGAMRPATRMSADGPQNLYDAVAVAADPRSRGRGVLVVVNDDIHSARDVTKTHTTDVQTFRSGEAGLVGTTLAGSIAFFRTPERLHTARSEFRVAEATALPRVDVIHAHAGMSADLVDCAVANGAKGLVFAGVGDGNLSAGALEAVRRARAKGVVVVRSSRVGGGVVRRNVEVGDDALGTVASMDLGPAKARVLLKLALRVTSDPKRIQEMFERY